MEGLTQSSGKYSILVTGGHANVGHRARMTFHRRQRRGYCTNTRTTSRITGPELRLKDVHSSVLDEVVFCLNNHSPLGNNWKAIAAEMGLNLPHIQSLDHHGPNGMMSGVLDIMFHKKMTVGDLVKMLHNIERLDVIEVLTKAGFQDNLVQENETDKEDFYSNQLQNAATETSTEIRCKEDGSNHQTFPEFTTPTSDSTQLENTKETNRITSQVTAYGVIYEELAKARASSSAEASNEGVATLEEKTSSCPILSGICRMWDFN